MKGKLFFILILVHSFFGVSAQQIPVKEFMIIHTFQIGKSDNALGYNDFTGSSDAPFTPEFVQGSGDIEVYDILNNRIVAINRKFLLQEKEILSESDFIPWHAIKDKKFSTIVLLYGEYNGIKVIDNQKEAYLSYTGYPELQHPRSIAYYDDVLFVTDKNLRMWSVPEPLVNPEKNREKLLNQEETMSYLTKRWGLNGRVRVDGLGRLFIDEELVTRDFPTWIGYKGLKSDLRFQFIGIDKFQNTYWNQEDMMYIYPRGEKKSKSFSFSLSGVSGYPTVDYQTGDLYFLGRPQGDSLPLYKIARDW